MTEQVSPVSLNLEQSLSNRLLAHVRPHHPTCLSNRVAAKPEDCTGKSSTDATTDEATQLGKTLTLALFQVLAGERSATQMGHWFDWKTHQHFEQHYGYVTRHRRRKEMRGETVVLYRQAQVLSARACQTTARTFEVSIVIKDATRVRAVAMQLKRIRQRWRISALEIG